MDAKFSLRLGASLPEIGPALDATETFLSNGGASEALAFRFRLAMDELLTNVVTHGAGESESIDIAVEAWIENDEAVCEISDDGPAFDPLSRPAPNLEADLEDRPIGGLGIHLVREMVPLSTYRRERGRNVVRLVGPLEPSA